MQRQRKWKFPKVSTLYFTAVFLMLSQERKLNNDFLLLYKKTTEDQSLNKLFPCWHILTLIFLCSHYGFRNYFITTVHDNFAKSQMMFRSSIRIPGKFLFGKLGFLNCSHCSLTNYLTLTSYSDSQKFKSEKKGPYFLIKLNFSSKFRFV